MPKLLEQRVAILVDIQNMYYSAKNLFHKKVNFGEILKVATGGRKLIRALAYGVHTESGEEKPFFEALKKSGFEVKEKDLLIYYGGLKKADWDVGITVDAVKLADKVDVIILVSGDGDFVPIVNYLQENKGCKVEVMAFRKSASSRIVEAADEFIDLSKSKRFLIHPVK